MIDELFRSIIKLLKINKSTHTLSIREREREIYEFETNNSKKKINSLFIEVIMQYNIRK